MRLPTDDPAYAAELMLRALSDDTGGFIRMACRNQGLLIGGLVRICITLGIEHYGDADTLAEQLSRYLAPGAIRDEP